MCLTGSLTFGDAQQLCHVALGWPGGAMVWAPFGSRPQGLTFWLLDLGVGGVDGGWNSRGS